MLLLITFLAGDPSVDAPAAQTALWQVVLAGCGALVTVAGASAVVWWFVWPRIKDGIEKIVLQVSETHRSVTVNHHSSPEPTMRDDISDVKKQVSDVKGQLEQVIAVSGASTQRVSDLGDLVSGLSDRVADVHDIARDTKTALEDHEARGERYLGKVEVVLKDKGIELPPSD